MEFGAKWHNWSTLFPSSLFDPLTHSLTLRTLYVILFWGDREGHGHGRSVDVRLFVTWHFFFVFGFFLFLLLHSLTFVSPMFFFLFFYYPSHVTSRFFSNLRRPTNQPPLTLTRRLDHRYMCLPCLYLARESIIEIAVHFSLHKSMFNFLLGCFSFFLSFSPKGMATAYF